MWWKGLTGFNITNENVITKCLILGLHNANTNTKLINFYTQHIHANLFLLQTKNK